MTFDGVDEASISLKTKLKTSGFFRTIKDQESGLSNKISVTPSNLRKLLLVWPAGFSGGVDPGVDWLALLWADCPHANSSLRHTAHTQYSFPKDQFLSSQRNRLPP